MHWLFRLSLCVAELESRWGSLFLFWGLLDTRPTAAGIVMSLRLVITLLIVRLHVLPEVLWSFSRKAVKS